MQDTPIHLNGPFTLDVGQYAHRIIGRDGVAVLTLDAMIVDRGLDKSKYPTGLVRTPSARLEEAKFILEAMNARFETPLRERRIKPLDGDLLTGSYGGSN